MNLKFKMIVSALALSFATTSFAALTPASTTAFTTNASTGNSSLVFSAWNGSGSYTFDLGYALNNLVGVDTISAVTGANATPNTNNALTAATAITSPSAYYDILLTGFNATGLAASGATWNLVAADTSVRNRALVSQATAGGSATNSVVANIGTALNNFLSLNLQGSSSNPVTATSTDAWYANAAGWGDSLGSSGLTGTGIAYGDTAALYLAYQNSTKSANSLSAAGFSDTTYTAFTHYGTGLNASDLYLTIQAVPEADTSAMMIAGIGLMGFIARRR